MASNQMVTLWLCLAVFALVRGEESTCGVGDPCNCHGIGVNCLERGLKTVPQFSHGTVPSDTIDVSYNKITRIEAGAFANLSLASAVEIFLDHNPLEFVDDMAFDGLQNISIRSMRLQDTHLKTLPKALKLLNNLKEIEAYGMTLDTDVMKKVGPSLESLTFGSVPSWPTSLRYANHLKTLEVLDLGVSTFPDDAFVGLETSLSRFTFQGPTLTQPPNAMCRLQNLHELRVLTVKFPSGVSVIPVCSHPMTSVKILTLYEMKLSTFPNISDVFPSLTALYLNWNFMTYVPDSLHLSNLVTLEMNVNSFVSIPRMIRNMRQLESLEMENNNITSVTVGSFYGLNNLQRVNLNYNPVSSIADDAFGTNPNLNELEVKYGVLTTVPTAIKRLQYLNLVMPVNRVKCSCDLAWLVNWEPLKSGHVTIDGNCHPNSLQDLYEYISTKLPTECEVGPIG